MEHLTMDEILEFVSMTELNCESIKLSTTVNGHIRKCDACLKLVRSVQMLYDEFARLDLDGGFKNFIADNLSEIRTETPVAAASAPNEIDGLR